MLPRGEEDEKVVADKKIIINFDEARKLILNGISCYTSEYGIIRHEKSRNQAEHLREYLVVLEKETDPFRKEMGLLALFLAIFDDGKPLSKY